MEDDREQGKETRGPRKARKSDGELEREARARPGECSEYDTGE